MSETGFVSHKKTQYEEAMYKCEEERYEFDLNIEANLHTISLLEPWAVKIEEMSQEEKVNFRLPRDLGGLSTSIFQRVIKKIYDRERGLEVIDAIFSEPAIAIPVVLKRLKQKDEEWKRSQVILFSLIGSVNGTKFGVKLTLRILQSPSIIRASTSRHLTAKLCFQSLS